MRKPPTILTTRTASTRSIRLVAIGAMVLSLPTGMSGPRAAQGQVAPEAQAELAGDPLSTLRGEVHRLELDVLKARALREELADEERALDASGDEGPRAGQGDRLTVDKDFWTRNVDFRPLPSESTVSGLDAAETLARSLEKELQAVKVTEQTALERWNESVRADLAFHARRASVEDQAGRPWDAPGGPPLLGTLVAPVGLGLVAVVVGLAFTLHEARRPIRCRLRAVGSRPSDLATVLALSLGLVGGQAIAAESLAQRRDRDREELIVRRDALQAELARLNAENAEVVRRLDDRLERFRRQRATFGFWPSEAATAARAEHVTAETKAAHEAFRAIRVALKTVKSLKEKTVELRNAVRDGERSLSTFWTGNRAEARRGSLIRLSTYAALGLAALGPLHLVRRRAKRKLNLESRLCPQCEALDTVRVPDGDEPESAEEPERKIKAKMAVCGECDYEIRENYLRQNRLSFPTLGIRGSGKTHWVGILYDQIKNANLSVASSLRKLPSRHDAIFDQIVRQLHYDRRGPENTKLDRPRPLVFHVKDADPLGANRTTVNLFDAAGELSRSHVQVDRDYRRLRLLRCQGFALFLDPTQVVVGPWSENDTTIEDQIETLAHFSEELHAVRGVPVDRAVDLPVAVCISKIDLLNTQNPIGSQALPFISALRDTMDRDVDLDLIHERSRLCARAMPMLFPNWNVERTLREQFGGRYMFFPVCPVGLEESELGLARLADRTYAPFGVLEPLLWLLHMHGYSVLR